MLTFISCAKTMAEIREDSSREMTEPRYGDHALHLGREIARMSGEELGRILRVSPRIAAENRRRYLDLVPGTAPRTEALSAYTGVVFQHIAPENFTEEDWAYAREHLRITSFLYGLLRPTDGIAPYRMEGDARLECNDGRTLFEYWREVLTGDFIAEIKARGGILMNLASAEMKGLFDWKRVEREVRVITPEFKVWKGDRLSTIVIYAKMCRGEMTRHILKNRIEDPTRLRDFEWEGFAFDPERSDERHYMFTMR